MGSTGKSAETKNYTVEDIQSYGIKWQPSMNRLSEEMRQSIINQIGAMYEEFPQLRGFVNQIKVAKNVDTDMGYYSNGKQAGTIVISDNYSNLPIINYVGMANNVFVVDNNSQLVTHELAHALARAAGANSEWKSMRGVDYKKLRAVSGYAAEQNTDREIFAEAVADYMIHKNKARDVSKEVVKNVHKLLGN